MFGRSFKLFRLFGFTVKVDLSWFILFALITWSLGDIYFPGQYPSLTEGTCYTMGAVCALGLFLSIVLHELSHSLVARAEGLPIGGITLFIFGGVAEMTEEPKSPGVEFLMAIAGPIASVVIGAVCFGVYYLGTVNPGGWPIPVTGVLFWVGFVNLVLAAFNLIPAFPLDGGRVLRSILWWWKKSIRWATHITSNIGMFFGFFLIAVGIWSFFRGNLIGGVWLFLIGMFLQGAARMSFQQLLLRQSLEGEPISRFMRTNPVTVSPDLSLDHLVQDYFYRYHYKMFPVQRNGDLMGCITTRDIGEVPREEWSQHHVEELVRKCGDDNSVSPDTDAMQVLSRMNRTKASRLLVVDGNHLVGLITLKDMLDFLSMKIELEEKGNGSGR